MSKISKIASILIILLSTCGHLVHAQYYNDDYYRLTGGLVGGANISQVDGDGYKGYDKLGFTGGGVLFLPFGDMEMPLDATIALSLEVLYTQKGAIGPDVIPGTSFRSQEIRLHYAEVPVQINLYRGPRKSGFGAGFSIGYLGFSEELVDKGGGVVIKDALPFNKFDLNFVLTGNIHIWQGFYLSPRFQYSLISVRNNNGAYGGRNEQFNNVLALRLIYLVGQKNQ